MAEYKVIYNEINEEADKYTPRSVRRTVYVNVPEGKTPQDVFEEEYPDGPNMKNVYLKAEKTGR